MLKMIFLTLWKRFLGAEIFVSLELPHEEENYAAKRERAEEVDAATKYLSTAIW